MISIIHPSRGRPEKSLETYKRWLLKANTKDIEFILSIDSDEPTDDAIGASKYITLYNAHSFNISHQYRVISNANRSCVDAINNAAKIANGDIFIVVSDDTDCWPGWDDMLLKVTRDKTDYLLKCKDGIQDYIVTMTVMDRKYYERDGYIYHPDFRHQFADTYLTCVADIRGRLIYSDLEFKHNHYSVLKEQPDALNKRNDDTWKEGQKTFVRLMKQFTPEERERIKDPSMRGFLKHVGL